MIVKYLIKFFVLAVKWFRCETNMEIVQAEIHEMEADFQNIQTNASRVMTKKNKKAVSTIPAALKCETRYSCCC
jgi:hypothetical protein